MNTYDIQRIIDLYEKYKSMEKISELCEMKNIKVRRILIDNGYTVGYKQKRIKDMQDSGLSNLEISRLLGISLDKVYENMPTNKYKINK